MDSIKIRDRYEDEDSAYCNINRDIPPIRVLHPSPIYIKNGHSPFLFALPCYDQDSKDEDKFGIQKDLVQWAASIICGNTGGRLLRIRLDNQAELESMASVEDYLLSAGDYYWYPTGWRLADDPYPITLNFEDWCFPHGQVPNEWETFYQHGKQTGELLLPASARSFVDSKYCSITRWSSCCEIAHIIPKHVEDWFDVNGMERYNRSISIMGATDPNNLVLLREDIRSAFDHKAFVILPKDDDGNWAVHFLRFLHPLTHIYHNRKVAFYLGLGEISKEFLYARFAWSLFPLNGNIVKSNCGIMVNTLDPETNEYVTRKMNRNDMKAVIQRSSIPSAKEHKITSEDISQLKKSLQDDLEAIAHRLHMLLPSGVEAHYVNNKIELCSSLKQYLAAESQDDVR